MLSKRVLRSIVMTLTLAMLLSSTALTLAQETAQTAAPPPAGVGTLFLLIGLGAVGLVSLVVFMRERSAGNNDDAA
jgi:hypothetical protein